MGYKAGTYDRKLSTTGVIKSTFPELEQNTLDVFQLKTGCSLSFYGM